MGQPLYFEKDGNLLCQLKKSMYGLQQAPRAWYEKIDGLFLNLGFKCYELHHNIYVLHLNGETLIFACM